VSELTHLDEQGRAQMVDVAAKPVTQRRAVARAVVRMSAATATAIAAGETPKGDVTAAARLAGIGAAKRTGELIPLCHPLALDFVGVDVDVEANAVVLTAEARATARTGVEMEALTAAAVAALTVYDMIKGIERGARIETVELLEKSGGRSGAWRRPVAESP
jgi:cyclic pyranopterin phosphate synthase